MGEAIEVRLRLADELWQARCDVNQLESAILNLAINSRDAMPDGGTLTIETLNETVDVSGQSNTDVAPGQYVCVAVSDTGTGMSQETADRAFEPFFTTKEIGRGTGLGLSMIYGFARQSKGQAKILSELGRGTTVKLYLPASFEAVEIPVLEIANDEIRPANSGEVVLVVEDDPFVRSQIVEVLHDLGCTVLEASDGPSGLQMLQWDTRIDLLITDLGLPGLNGRQVADGGRHRRPDLKVLFMTGYAESTTAPEGFLRPGMQLVTKPFSLDAIATRINRMLHGIAA